MKRLEEIKSKPLQKLLDGLWTAIVKKDKRYCELCGEEPQGGQGGLNAHHLISRAIKAYRWDLENAALLCAGCHTFRVTSVHVSPWVFYDNLDILLDSARATYFKSRKNNLHPPPPTLENLQAKYRDLNKKYSELFGKDFRKTIVV